MKITFLGTASCFPTPTRGVSSIAVQLDSGEVWLFDCGEGTQTQMMKSLIKPGKITKIFITHLHGDHVFGLPGFLCTLSSSGLSAKSDGEATCQIDLYGPLGIRKFVNTCLELSRSILSFRLHIHELVPKECHLPEDWNSWATDFEYCGNNDLLNNPISDTIEHLDQQGASGSDPSSYWDVIRTSKYEVRAGALKHRIPCFAYVIKEMSQPGTLDPKKCEELGVKPGPDFGRLKAEKSVTAENGRVVHWSEVLGPRRPGRKIAILGDTKDGSESLRLCHGADLLIHEATMENALEDKAVSFGHSTPKMAAQFAIDSNAKRLCLTHVSPRYRPMSFYDEKVKHSKAEELAVLYGESSVKLLHEAEEHLKKKNRSCLVELAEDFMVIEIHALKPASEPKSTDDVQL